MTREELIQDFENYIAVVALAKSKLRERDELRCMMSSIKSGLNTDGMPHAHGQEPDKMITDIISKLDDLDKIIAESLSKVVAARIQVEHYFDLLADKPKYHAVLQLYYIEDLSMEDVSRKMRNVPGVMHYSKKQCWRYYNDAIEIILKRLKDVPKCPI